jgi:hypothetical protein
MENRVSFGTFISRLIMIVVIMSFGFMFAYIYEEYRYSSVRDKVEHDYTQMAVHMGKASRALLNEYVKPCTGYTDGHKFGLKCYNNSAMFESDCNLVCGNLATHDIFFKRIYGSTYEIIRGEKKVTIKCRNEPEVTLDKEVFCAVGTLNYQITH